MYFLLLLSFFAKFALGLDGQINISYGNIDDLQKDQKADLFKASSDFVSYGGKFWRVRRETDSLVKDVTEDSNKTSVPHDTTTFKPDNSTSDQEFRTLLGVSVELECSITNIEDSNLTVNWSRTDGLPLPTNSIQRKRVLYIANIKQEDQGKYKCTAYDSIGKPIFSVSTKLAIVSPPFITLSVPPKPLHPGESAYINCSATGQQPIEISWLRLRPDKSRSLFSTDGHMRFNSIQVNDAGIYLCVATNAVGQAEAFVEVSVQDD